MINVISNRIEIAHPHVHPDAKMRLSFQRTFRVGDVGTKNFLPPNLGTLPCVPVVGRVAERLGPAHAARGGVAICMSAADALYVQLEGIVGERRPKAYPFAVAAYAGKRSIVTGAPYEPGLRPKDYGVVPEQLYFDGFVTGEGVVRQFVASPLKLGVTVEAQLTGGAEAFGGLQFDISPMISYKYDLLFPQRPQPVMRSRGVTRGGSSYDDGVLESFSSRGGVVKTASVATMGMAAGGEIRQQVFEDPYGIEAWDQSLADKFFVHLVPAGAWEYVTGMTPPPSPATPERYKQAGYAWYDYYVDNAPSLGGGPNVLSQVKSAAQIAEEGGPDVLPYNADTTPAKVVPIPAKPQGNVPPGTW